MADQLECRIIITHRPDQRIDMGMYSPCDGRYEPLGTHGPAQQDIDKAVEGLKRAIIGAGHYLTFCERSVNTIATPRKSKILAEGITPEMIEELVNTWRDEV